VKAGCGGAKNRHILKALQRDEEATVDVFEVSGSIKWFDASRVMVSLFQTKIIFQTFYFT
jgi:hypothetical protein